MFGAKYNADDVITRAHALLKVMEAQLSRRDFLVGGNATLADGAGYSYVSAAPEGNVDLGAYPNVHAWLARIEALPGFVHSPHERQLDIAARAIPGDAGPSVAVAQTVGNGPQYIQGRDFDGVRDASGGQ